MCRSACDSRSAAVNWHGERYSVDNMLRQAAAILFTLGIVGHASAQASDFIARFEGGIGVIPVSNGAGPANPDGTLPNARLNVVRGVNPGAGPWQDRRPSSRHRRHRPHQGARAWPAPRQRQQHRAERQSECFRDLICEAVGSLRPAQHCLQCSARAERRLSNRRHADVRAVRVPQPGAAHSQHWGRVVRGGRAEVGGR